MQLAFTKYHGTGNDFVIVDGRTLTERLDQTKVSALCDRHFGVGADGFIIVKPSAQPGADYEMVYYNSDGNVGSMCGNGARCAYHFARTIGLASDASMFLAYDGMHTAEMSDDLIAVSMRDVSVVNQREEDVYVLNTGSPHYVRFVDDVAMVDVFHEGRSIRNSADFVRDGINVNFVQILDDGLKVRTYERGVEDITLSCGTGVTAVALAYATRERKHHGPVRIIADGGNLTVDFRKNATTFSSILLIGPATPVFSSSITL